MTTIGLFLSEAWTAAIKRRDEERRKRKFRAVALAFNDLHTHTSRQGRWMCPDCNKVHSAMPELSVFTGLQYPACCRAAEGHRLFHSDHATTGNYRT